MIRFNFEISSHNDSAGNSMFSIFKKDPVAKLQNNYQAVLEQAMQAQRKGDIRLYSELSGKAEGLAKQIDEFKKAQ